MAADSAINVGRLSARSRRFSASSRWPSRRARLSNSAIEQVLCKFTALPDYGRHFSKRPIDGKDAVRRSVIAMLAGRWARHT